MARDFTEIKARMVEKKQERVTAQAPAPQPSAPPAPKAEAPAPVAKPEPKPAAPPAPTVTRPVQVVTPKAEEIKLPEPPAAPEPPKFSMPPDARIKVDYQTFYDRALGTKSGAVMATSKVFNIAPERLEEVARVQGVDLDAIVEARKKGRTYAEIAKAGRERGVIGFMPVEEREAVFFKTLTDVEKAVRGEAPEMEGLKRAGADKGFGPAQALAGYVAAGTQVELPEVSKPGEYGHTVASLLVDAIRKDKESARIFDLYGRSMETGATQGYIRDRTEQLRKQAGIGPSDPESVQKVAALRRRAINEVIAYKTVGQWTPAVTLGDIEVTEGREAPSFFGAMKPNVEIIGFNNKRQAIFRQESPMGVAFRAIDIPQSATVGVLTGKGAATGVQTGSNFLEYAMETTKDSAPYVRAPALAAGMAASIAFPDLTLFGGKAAALAKGAYQSVRVKRVAPKVAELLGTIAEARKNKDYTRAIEAEIELRKYTPDIASGHDRYDASVAAKQQIIDPMTDTMNEDLASLIASRIPAAADEAASRSWLHPSVRKDVLSVKTPTKDIPFTAYDELYNTDRLLKRVGKAKADYLASVQGKTLADYATDYVRGAARSIVTNLADDVLEAAKITPQQIDEIADVVARSGPLTLRSMDDFKKAVRDALKADAKFSVDAYKPIRQALYRRIGQVERKVADLKKVQSVDELVAPDIALFDRAIKAIEQNNEARGAAAEMLRDEVAGQAKIRVVPSNLFADVAPKLPNGEPMTLSAGGLVALAQLRRAAPEIPLQEAYAATLANDKIFEQAAKRAGVDVMKYYEQKLVGFRRGDKNQFVNQLLTGRPGGAPPAPAAPAAPTAAPAAAAKPAFSVSAHGSTASKWRPSIAANTPRFDVESAADAKQILDDARRGRGGASVVTATFSRADGTVGAKVIALGDVRVLADSPKEGDAWKVIVKVGTEQVELPATFPDERAATFQGVERAGQMIDARVVRGEPAIQGVPAFLLPDDIDQADIIPTEMDDLTVTDLPLDVEVLDLDVTEPRLPRQAPVPAPAEIEDPAELLVRLRTILPRIDELTGADTSQTLLRSFQLNIGRWNEGRIGFDQLKDFVDRKSDELAALIRERGPARPSVGKFRIEDAAVDRAAEVKKAQKVIDASERKIKILNGKRAEIDQKGAAAKTAAAKRKATAAVGKVDEELRAATAARAAAQEAYGAAREQARLRLLKETQSRVIEKLAKKAGAKVPQPEPAAVARLSDGELSGAIKALEEGVPGPMLDDLRAEQARRATPTPVVVEEVAEAPAAVPVVEAPPPVAPSPAPAAAPTSAPSIRDINRADAAWMEAIRTFGENSEEAAAAFARRQDAFARAEAPAPTTAGPPTPAPIAAAAEAQPEAAKIVEAPASPEDMVPPAKAAEEGAPVDLPIPEEKLAPILDEMVKPAKTPEQYWKDPFVAPKKTVSIPKNTPEITLAEANARISEWKAEAQRQGRTGKNGGKVVLSLFDASGEWSKPWREAGYDVHQFDIQRGDDIRDFSAKYLLENYDFDMGNVYAILTAPPCTDFTVSGAQWWKLKDADGRTTASISLVNKTKATIEFFKPTIWVLENPVGRIKKLADLPKPTLSFNPHNYGNPYTKRTLLWGDFNPELPLANVFPSEGSRIHKLSGKDKYGRSLTPEGFAYAFFMANNAESLGPVGVLSREFRGVPASLFERAVKAGLPEDEIRYAIQDAYHMEDSLDEVEAAINTALTRRGLTAPSVEAPAPAKRPRATRVRAEAAPEAAPAAEVAPTDVLKQVSPTGEVKGAVEWLKDGRALITLFEGADASTVLHEVAHVVRRNVLNADDMEAITAWIKSRGVKVGHEFGEFTGDADEIEKAEELFAKAFEQYVAEGALPTPTLTSVFDILKNAVGAVYRGVSDPIIGTRLQPQVRAMFDGLLATTTEQAAPSLKQVVRREILGGADDEEDFFDILAREAQRKGIGKAARDDLMKRFDDVEAAVKAQNRNLRDADVIFQFPAPVFGKRDWTFRDLVQEQAKRETTAKLKAARRAGIRMDLAATGRGTAALVQEETPVESLRAMVAARETDTPMAANVRSAFRTVVGAFFGGDVVLEQSGDARNLLRQAPPEFRKAVNTAVRVVEQSIGDTVGLLNDAVDLNDSSRLLDYLSGSTKVRRANGRPILSSGHDYTASVLQMWSRRFAQLTAEERVAMEYLADAVNAPDASTRLARLGFNMDGTTFKAADTAAEKIREGVVRAAGKMLYSSKSGKDVDFGEALSQALRNAVEAPDNMRPSHEMKLLETITYVSGSTARGGSLFKGDSRKATELLIFGEPGKKNGIRNIYNDESARRATVLVGGFGASVLAKNVLLNIDLGVDAATQRGFANWLAGEQPGWENVQKIQDMVDRYGFNPEFVRDPILDMDFYIPRMARERIAQALSRSTFRPQEALTGGDLLRTGFTYWKLRVTRGNLFIRQRYFMMNTVDNFNAVGLTAGFGVAAANTARVVAQDLMVLPFWQQIVLAARNLPGGQRIPADVLERARVGLQKLGDRGAQRIGSMMGISKYRIEVNPVLEGLDGGFRAGGKVYSYREIRRIAVEEGVFASFETRELQNAILREGELIIRQTTEGPVLASGTNKGRAASILSDWQNSVKDVADAWSERERLGTMITLMEAGHDPRTAARITIDALYDYSQTMTKADRGMLVSILFPFWAFQKNANAQIFNMLFSPSGAYRMMAIKRARERSADLMTAILYGDVTDEYGVDVESMPPELQDSYYAVITAFEESFGVDGPPPEAKQAMRLLLAGRAMDIVGGKLVTTSPTIIQLQQSGALAEIEKFQAFAVAEPSQAGRASFMRDRAGVAVSVPRTEAVRTAMALLGDDHAYMEIFWPDSVIEAGMKYHTQVAASMLLMGAYGADFMGLVDLKEEGLEGVSPLRVLEPVADPTRSPVVAAIASGEILGSAPPKRLAPLLTPEGMVKIHPLVGKMMDDYYGAAFLRLPKEVDPFIVNEQGQLTELPPDMQERIRALQQEYPDIGVIKDQRYYVFGGKWAVAFDASPLGELNSLLLQWEEEPLQRADIRGEILRWARGAAGVDVSLTAPSRTVKYEEPTKPSETRKF